MHILIVNDDGINAAGIAALEAAAYSVADEISVVAPLHEHSAQSHAITVHKPILVNRITHPSNVVRYAVEGTPCDCARLAILELCSKPVDLVLSGVNHGANMGWEIFFSGTVSAAAEGYSFGIPSVAFSLGSWTRYEFQSCQRAIERLLPTFVDLAKREKSPFLYNVNVPAVPYGDIRGVRMTTLEPNVKGDRYERRKAPDGRDYFWATWGDRHTRSASLTDPRLDVVAVREKFISVTRLHYEVSPAPSDDAMIRRFEGLSL